MTAAAATRTARGPQPPPDSRKFVKTDPAKAVPAGQGRTSVGAAIFVAHLRSDLPVQRAILADPRASKADKKLALKRLTKSLEQLSARGASETE